jgi:hypothetical protein
VIRPPDTSLEGIPETDRGKAMFQELLWVHAAIRRDLEIVARLCSSVERCTALGNA